MEVVLRREFIKKSGQLLAFFAAAGSLIVQAACNATDVWHEIEQWVPLGIDGFNSIIALVDPLMSPAITAITTLIKAGFAVLSGAIDDYINAPAADKSSLIGKVETALTDLSNHFQDFVTAISVSGNPIVTIAVALIKIILDTISGFVQKIVPTAAHAMLHELRAGATVVTINPVLRNRKEFIAVFNSQCVSSGHPELQLKQTK